MTDPKPRAGRPPSMDDPRGTLCAAAARLFAAQGYDVTSLADVAGAVGMTKAGLYHYFPTKQALFEAVVMDTLADLTAGARAALDGPGDTAARVTRFMQAHAAWFSANRDRYRASFFGRAGGAMTDFTPEQLQARRAYVDLLTDLLAQGHATGEIEAPDPAVTARGILGMLNWMARWYRPDGPQSAEEIAEGYARLVLGGLRPRT